MPAQLTKSKLVEILKKKYPDHKWEKLYLLRGRFAQQKRLQDILVTIFPVSYASFSP